MGAVNPAYCSVNQNSAKGVYESGTVFEVERGERDQNELERGLCNPFVQTTSDSVSCFFESAPN
jgi:hypothetical protein